MIHLSSIAVEEINKPAAANEKSEWKRLLSDSKISTQALLRTLDIESHSLADSAAEALFELRVPKPYLDKMERGNPNDPLLLQVLPQHAESIVPRGYVDDPLEESNYTPARGVIHKYQSRVLFVSNQSCAVHCRYCFRRSFPYSEHRQSRQEWLEALAYIESQPEVNEVILSGGDPLTLSNDYLGWLLDEISKVQQIKRVRIHSRLPIVLPQRIDTELLALFSGFSKRLVLVVHSNHPNEIGDDVIDSMRRLKTAGLTLLNQSVLLKGINNNASVLAQLSEKLFDADILPYYLFTLDKVKGASHFEISLDEAKAIYKELQAQLPGFLLPKLASEIPGRASKSLVTLD